MLNTVDDLAKSLPVAFCCDATLQRHILSRFCCSVNCVCIIFESILASMAVAMLLPFYLFIYLQLISF